MHAQTREATTAGRVLHSARAYDWLARLLLGGRERAFRERILELGQVSVGASVLDVGCGTGTLAILAKERVGRSGAAHGIDASSEMVAEARRKAKRAGVEVVFEEAVVEAMPFPAQTFDVVLSSLMLHHLPRSVREQCAREMRRVAKPGGRVVVVDFGARTRPRSFLERFHRYGRVELVEVQRVLTDAGFQVERSGPMGLHDLQFVVARVP